MKARALGMAIALAGCAPPPAPPATAASPYPPARPSPNKPPASLCKREIAQLGDLQSSPTSVEDDGAPPVPRAAAPARATAKRRVVLESHLPPRYSIVALVFPASGEVVKLDAPATGPFAEIDARGVHGEVGLVIREKLSGGLYDYVGACDVARAYVDIAPWNPAAKTPKSLPDVVVVVDLAGGRPYLDIQGASDPAPAEPLPLRF